MSTVHKSEDLPTDPSMDPPLDHQLSLQIDPQVGPQVDPQVDPQIAPEVADLAITIDAVCAERALFLTRQMLNAVERGDWTGLEELHTERAELFENASKAPDQSNVLALAPDGRHLEGLMSMVRALLLLNVELTRRVEEERENLGDQLRRLRGRRRVESTYAVASG